MTDGADRFYDIAIIGAGPAGLGAAEVIRESSLKTIVIDEQPRAGGQILRRPPASFEVEDWLASPYYDRVKSTLRIVENCPNIRWKHSTTVLGVRPVAGGERTPPCPQFEIWLQNEQGCATIHASVVLLATGCFEQPLPIPGWTLPGVMGAGAIQAFVKSQQLVPGSSFVLAGSHPLQLVVADQLVAGGATVAAIVFTQRFLSSFRLLRYPLEVLQNAGLLMETATTVRRLQRAGVRMLFGRSISRVDGIDQVERVAISEISDDGRLDHQRSEIIPCDRVGLCYGFQASSELARLAGAEVYYVANGGGWIVKHNSWFESSLPGLFVAGEVTGLAGADASLEKGRLAGLGILRTLGQMNDADVERRARAPRRQVQRAVRFAAMLSQLSAPPPLLAASSITRDTVICRCEQVTHGELIEALQEYSHIASADAVKLLSRAGMGMCQGRFCAEHVTRTVAGARRLTTDDVGNFRTQFPVKPLNIGRM